MTTATQRGDAPTGRTPAHGHTAPAPDGSFVTIGDDRYYAIGDVDHLPPFLMSIVSDGDRWMFLSSSGALTAGRRDANRALFPYETDDRLHHLGGLNGAVTAIRLLDGTTDDVWRPTLGIAGPHRHRSLFKAVRGDAAVFEESDDVLGLTFRYRWASSDRFGFIRTATLVNDGTAQRRIQLVDGIRNILPDGLSPSIYLPMGNLANAYKRSEVIDPTLRLAVYSLESQVSDRPEPAEALRATTTWSVGLDDASVLLDPEAASVLGRRVATDAPLVTGKPGAYFLTTTVALEPGEEMTWSIVSDVGLDQPGVEALIERLRRMPHRAVELAASTSEASRNLVEIMARADALQCTADEVATAHHYSDVVYNVMRGGLPLDGYAIDVADFARHLATRNAPVAERNRSVLTSLGPVVARADLLSAIDETDDVDLRRLGREYLPFSFSRRHGDPSRPWNAFSIRTTDDDGRARKYFEGNWRDIFQNWEAMAASYPEYFPDIVAVFVNASTADGFNPYRVTSDGIDWEVPEPDDPWSNIGYWGDHQIVYLLRLLVATERHLPGAIRELLGEERFAYADVPYRIAPYEQIVADPKATITFDERAAARAETRVDEVGADGRLLWADGSVYHVTLLEKLVVPVLAKLSNLVPGGGIWMNTQRPEWNDANNALVGHGVSMVTLYQLRAFLSHLRTLVDGSPATVAMSREVAEWLHDVSRILTADPVKGDGASADSDRKALLDALGTSFSEYRRRLYVLDGFTGTSPVSFADVAALCDVAMPHLDEAIVASRRADGLYESYNLVDFSDDGERASVERLGAMLEGQVAVIESGVLTTDACADIVDALFASDLYRPDQNTFILYPARVLPGFLDRNVVPDGEIEANPLLSALLDGGVGAIVVRDVRGRIRFGADLTTRDALERELDHLAADPAYGELVKRNRAGTIRTYERVFGHHSYTGRSGSMYAYEGVGSIYWHMVAKLLVAIQEAAFAGASAGGTPGSVDRLVDAYWKVRSGLGFNKTPAEHGAIPIDPYSHTPSHAGAQQPGMTGLVKEELLVRPAELGITVSDGEIVFDPRFLSEPEALLRTGTWSVFDVAGEWRDLELPPGVLASTLCQVPVIVHIGGDGPRVEVEHSDGRVSSIPGTSVGAELSYEVFARSGTIRSISAFLPVISSP